MGKIVHTAWGILLNLWALGGVLLVIFIACRLAGDFVRNKPLRIAARRFRKQPN